MTRSPQQRQAISEGTRAALARRKSAGLRTGELPFGWRVSTTGEPDRIERCPREQRALALIRELAECGLSTRQIADILTKEMPGAARGRRFYQPTIVRLLQRVRSG